MAEEKNLHRNERSSSQPSPAKKRRRRSTARRVFNIIGTLVLIGALTCSFLACFAAVYIKNVIMPQADTDLAKYTMDLSSTIYYTDPDTGALLEYETLSGDENRVRVAYEDVPSNLVNALVAIEDKRFYRHHGVDWLRTFKSAFTTFTGGRTQGGSTITQQLIKNITHYDDVTVKRKVLEIFKALEFDKKYSKTTTLEWYLNYVYFGRRCYGVYTAAYTYFGKDVSELSLAECASLIGITNNPSKYDPFTHPEANADRRAQVLEAMKKEGYITEEEEAAANAEVIDFHSVQSSGKTNSLYSWYTEQIITDVVNDLMEKNDCSQTIAEDLVYSGGLKIYACVDPKVQAAVDSIYSNAENLPYTSASGQPLQSAIVVIDPQGNIVALAGKMGEKTSADTRGYNMATRAMRQPGSSIKPLAVYAPALEMGLISPYSVFEDSAPMLLNGEPWPSNVNHRYLGQMTVSYAVANSTNTVAVRVLQEVTPEVSYEYLLDKFGVDEDHLVTKEVINGKEFSDIGYSQLALGGLTKGVTTLDMAAAYSVFPRDGIYIEPRTYSRVEDANGEVILSKESEGVPVLKETTTYYINELLKGVVSNGGGGDAYFPGMTIAGKTGSTTSNNDRWFVGYTPYYTAAIWVGYSTPERVSVSGNPAAKLWSRVMSQVHTDLPNIGFTKPSGLVEIEYCLDSGHLATEECRSDIRGRRTAIGYFFPEDAPIDYCEVHTMVTVCTADPILNEAGEPTGRFHLAGEFCPDSTVGPDGSETAGRVSVAVLALEREYVGGVYPEDNGYVLSALEEAGTCQVHSTAIPIEPTPYDPSSFDITNPATWPSREEDPNFNSADPSTWPTAGGHLVRPSETYSPAESLSPVHTPPSVPSESPSVNPPETTAPEGTSAPPPAPTGNDPLLPPGV